MRGLVAIALTALLLTSCAQNTDDQTANTLAPTTAKEPTLEDKLLEVHYAQMYQVIDTSQHEGWDEFRGWYEENSADPVRTRFVEYFGDLVEQGLVVKSPGVLSNIVSIDWQGASSPEKIAERGVIVTDCNLDRTVVYNPDGSVFRDRAGIFKTVDYVYGYELAQDRFRLQDVVTEDGRICDPVDLLMDDSHSVLPGTDDVLRVHRKLLTTALGGIDQRVEGYQSTYEAIDELTVTTEHDELTSYTESNENSGWFLDGGGYESNVVATQVRGDRATVVDCSRIMFGIYNAAGVEAVGPDDFYELRQTFLVRNEGQWRVEYLWEQGGQECDPSGL